MSNTDETKYIRAQVLWRCSACLYVDDDYKFEMKFYKNEDPETDKTFTVVHYCPKCNSTNVDKNYNG